MRGTYVVDESAEVVLEHDDRRLVAVLVADGHRHDAVDGHVGAVLNVVVDPQTSLRAAQFTRLHLQRKQLC